MLARHYARRPVRVRDGVWCWWPHRRLGFLWGDRFLRDIFSVRYGYAKVFSIGRLDVKWYKAAKTSENPGA